MRTHAPCGACGRLVPLIAGCVHWRPAVSQRARRNESQRRYREGMSAEQRDRLRAMNRESAARARARQTPEHRERERAADRARYARRREEMTG